MRPATRIEKRLFDMITPRKEEKEKRVLVETASYCPRTLRSSVVVILSVLMEGPNKGIEGRNVLCWVMRRP
jgi:hypothetical protein